MGVDDRNPGGCGRDIDVFCPSGGAAHDCLSSVLRRGLRRDGWKGRDAIHATGRREQHEVEIEDTTDHERNALPTTIHRTTSRGVGR